ncbi:cystatin-2-like [Hypanus sabinus]|uniref:cystatin-2-like n=1 Tax=Hypanus sabinus TaxID=79690 RepID=UPI0028C473B4|nr:cystatin-2-like [Hypanus sabinus]
MDRVLVLVVLLGAAAAAAEEERPPFLLGGLSPVPTDDPEVVNAIRVAEENFNRRSNDVSYTAVYNVTSAQIQVVEGLMYHLNLELRTTVCRKNEPDLRNCPFHQDPQHAKRMTCRFKVWYRPWVGPMEVNESQCTGVLK